jgi:hypothetical protein
VNDSTFLLQIQELLESSKLLFREELRIPEYLFNERPENFKDLLSQFYDQIMKVYEDFSDFKILKFQDEPINQGEKYIYYAKLVSKQILFLIKIPTKQEFTNAVMSHRGLEGSLEVEYYRLTKKMIKISKKLSKSRILYLLNPEYRLKHQQQQESFRLSENLDTEEVLEDEIDEDDDENINQID